MGLGRGSVGWLCTDIVRKISDIGVIAATGSIPGTSANISNYFSN